jgi:hypothetical protein
MNAELPEGVQITRARSIEKTKHSLAQKVGRAKYRTVLHHLNSKTPPAQADTIIAKIDEIMAQASFEVEVAPSAKSQRKHGNSGRDERLEPTIRDIRPGIHALKLVHSSPISIDMELAHGSKLHIKPSDILKALADSGDWRLTRVGLAMEDGAPLFERA